MTWQPIETAPRTREILVWCPESEDRYGYQTASRWGKHNHIPMYGWMRWHEENSEETSEIRPTLWQELPADPA